MGREPKTVADLVWDVVHARRVVEEHKTAIERATLEAADCEKALTALVGREGPIEAYGYVFYIDGYDRLSDMPVKNAYLVKLDKLDWPVPDDASGALDAALAPSTDGDEAPAADFTLHLVDESA